MLFWRFITRRRLRWRLRSPFVRRTGVSMRVQGAPPLDTPEGQAFWRSCPWAGDDEKSVRFRRILEEECG